VCGCDRYMCGHLSQWVSSPSLLTTACCTYMHLQYLDEELLRGGLKSGLFMRGYLRVNKHNPQYGACLVTAADMRCDPSYSPHVIAWVHTGRKRMWRWDSSRSG